MNNRGINLRTGYLMSTIPHLTTEHLSWAPESPYVHSSCDEGYLGKTRHYYSYNGAGSKRGELHPYGFVADWFVYDVDKTRRTWNNLHNKCLEYSWELKGDVRLLVPCHQSGRKIWTQSLKMDENAGLMIAVCEKNPNCQSWRWCGLREWAYGTDLPEFTLQRVTLS